MTRADRRHHLPSRPGPLAGLWIAAALVVAACGQAEEPGTGAGPTVADSDLAGQWRVTGLTIDGRAPTEEPITALVELETDFGGTAVDTDCGTSLGAFTLDPDGRAGFSLTGGSVRTCPPATATGSAALLDVLGRVDTWAGDGGELVLTTPDGDEVVLGR